jgi:hypothetical protein
VKPPIDGREGLGEAKVEAEAEAGVFEPLARPIVFLKKLLKPLPREVSSSSSSASSARLSRERPKRLAVLVRRERSAPPTGARSPLGSPLDGRRLLSIEPDDSCAPAAAEPRRVKSEKLERAERFCVEASPASAVGRAGDDITSMPSPMLFRGAISSSTAALLTRRELPETGARETSMLARPAAASR